MRVTIRMSSAPTSPVMNMRLRPRAWSASANSIRESSSLRPHAGEPVEEGERHAVGTGLVVTVGEEEHATGSPRPRPRQDRGGDLDDLLEIVLVDRGRRRLSTITTISGRVVSTSCLTMSVPVRAEVRQWMWRMSSPGTYSRSWWNDAVPCRDLAGRALEVTQSTRRQQAEVGLATRPHGDRTGVADPALGADEAERVACAAAAAARPPRCRGGSSRSRRSTARRGPMARAGIAAVWRSPSTVSIAVNARRPAGPRRAERRG